MLSALARLADGRICGKDVEISGLSGVDEAKSQDLTFLANPAYRHKLATTKAKAVIVPQEDAAISLPQLVVKDPYLAMAIISTALNAEAKPRGGRHESAIVDSTAEVATDAYIGPGSIVEAGAKIGAGAILKAQVYVGKEAVIGPGSILHPGAKVLDKCRLGSGVILYAGAIIGSDGFGYAPDATGKRHKIPQLGIVELADEVEVGAGATIDRATFGVTRIGHGTKIDNLVMVAHNVQVGENSILCAQSGIAGSTTVGSRVIIAGQAGINGHITIGNDVVVAGQAGVAKALEDGAKVAGAPAIPHLKWLKVSLLFSKLDEFAARLSRLERLDAKNDNKVQN